MTIQTEFDLEQDLLNSAEICIKVKESETYAQNLYAALCNNRFRKNEVWPILTDQYWSCSWRYAGGIIADIRNDGDYTNWYCSGISATGDDGECIDMPYNMKKFVPESLVTDEVANDLKSIGWIVLGDEYEK